MCFACVVQPYTHFCLKNLNSNNTALQIKICYGLISSVILNVLKLELKSLHAEVMHKIYLLLKTNMFPKINPQERNSLLIYSLLIYVG